MRLLTASLLFAASALAQIPEEAPTDDDSAPETVVIRGVNPAGSETAFQAEFLDAGQGETEYRAYCTGTEDYCAGGFFDITTNAAGNYFLATDEDNDGLLERDYACAVTDDVGICKVQFVDEEYNIISTAPESSTREGVITLSLRPGTATEGEGEITTTRTTEPQITSTIRATTTISTTVSSESEYDHAPCTCGHSNITTSAVITVSPVPSAGNNTTSPPTAVPSTVRPSTPAFTGAASSVKTIGLGFVGGSKMVGTVAGAMVAVAAMAFML